jgi:hypothetical protein
MATETGDSPTDTSNSTDSTEELSDYVRGITVTTVATMLGVLSGLLATLFATTDGNPDNFMGMMFLLGAVIVQFPVYQAVGIDVQDFGAKDQLYIFFMTFVLWFVTWSIMLTTGALQ